MKKATITLYYDSSDLVKITDVGNGDGHLAAYKWSYQYYYSYGELVFAYEEIADYPNEK